MSCKTLLRSLIAVTMLGAATAAHASFDGPRNAVTCNVVKPFRAGIYYIKPHNEDRQRVRLNLAKDGTYTIVGKPDLSFKLCQNTSSSYVAIACDKTLETKPCNYSLALPYQKRGLRVMSTYYAASSLLFPKSKPGEREPVVDLPYRSGSENAAFFHSLQAMKDRSEFREQLTILPE